MDIKINSKQIKSGDTFIAIKGNNLDGHNYIDEAIKNGATKIICEHGNYEVETVVVDNTKKYLNEYLYNNYYNKIKDIKLIGITGTNGKTTSAYLIYQALNKCNILSAYIGTIGFITKNEVKELNNTTPDILEVYEILLECSEKNIKYVVMEVSSHALELDRLNNLYFDIAIFTNLTQDHLDFHKTMDNYINSKKKLFDKINKNGYSIVNYDDLYANSIKTKDSILYGYNSNNFKILNYSINDGMKFNVEIDKSDYEFSTKLMGKFNVYNMMNVIITLYLLEINIDKIIQIVSELEPPFGRNYIIKYKTNNIVIDYAHTPDAVKKIINTALEYTKDNVYTIVGCGGNRDKTKRPIMGEIATSLSTEAIITSDNPRNEDPLLIIDDIIKGIKKNNYCIEVDRSRAIKLGISKLAENDTLLILGKGHENYQIINGVKNYFSDFDEVKKNIGNE